MYSFKHVFHSLIPYRAYAIGSIILWPRQYGTTLDIQRSSFT